ncbi:hypothetical protein CUS_6010 [Ruminococcus albus 8]|uniref:Uncharacterized protein n=1 Tax=Ruminococcus albus 8 TaxID=246199 RepID=E9SCZ8_RUMAL|nr:hypothetical protein CUS_6010 [Ruminococcus albus 8]
MISSEICTGCAAGAENNTNAAMISCSVCKRDHTYKKCAVIS